jgi:hypothetical protein
LVRFLVSQSSDQGFAEFMAFQPWEKWLYGISFGWFLLAVWNLLVRRRCPRCRSTDLDCVDEREVDRWVAPKKVYEKVGKDTYANRSVPTTYVRIKYTYECLGCRNAWAETVKKEKS